MNHSPRDQLEALRDGTTLMMLPKEALVASIKHLAEQCLDYIPEDPSVPEDLFMTDLRALINKHSKESGSDTPDFILAEYLVQSLRSFDYYVRMRAQLQRSWGRGVTDLTDDEVEEIRQASGWTDREPRDL